MTKEFFLPEISDKPFRMESNFWTGKVKLFHNNLEVPKAAKPVKTWLVKDASGKEVPVKIRVAFPANFYAEVDGKRINIYQQSLKWYDWALCCLPFALLGTGGAIGGGLAGLGFVVNANFARMESLTVPLKIFLMLLTPLTAFGIYLVIAKLVMGT